MCRSDTGGNEPMRTIFLTTSPKKHKKWANSTYFLWLIERFLAGKDTVRLNLGGKKDYQQILEACKEADTVIMAMPVYVDAIPSHVLAFLEEAEVAAKQENWHCKVYTITNCGFYEGVQCEFLLEQMNCWCHRSQLEYGGGLGVGAGEMLGILRLTNIAFAFLLLAVEIIIGLIASLVSHQPLFPNVLNSVEWISIGINIGLFFLFSMGLYINTFRFAQAIRKQKTVKNRYTTVWFCGRWMFMFFASIFWILRSIGHFVPFWTMFYKVPKESKEE